MSALLSDPAVKDASMLALTYVVREGVVDRRLSKFNEVAAIGGSQFVYDKFLASYFGGMLSGLTGENYWSGLLGNAAGLSLVLYMLRRSGLSSAVEVDDGAILPSPSSPMLSAVTEASELLIEKMLLQQLLGKTNLPLVGGGSGSGPEPAKTLPGATY
jgi:hypothetical protein